MLKVLINGPPNKKEQSRTFTFMSDTPVADRDAMKDALAAALQKIYQKKQAQQQQQQQIASHIADGITNKDEHTKLLSSQEIQIRREILKKNKDLMKLHMELVLNGLISEEEFWSIRKVIYKIYKLKFNIYDIYLNI